MEPFKNTYNKDKLVILSSHIKNVYLEFDENAFLSALLNDNWEEKELKQRIRAISTQLGNYLPNNYQEALNILKQVHHHFDKLFHLIFPDFVEVYGLEYFEDSMEALKLFTPQCSSEFAIRPFIIKYPQTIDILKQWAKDENEHVRRLASEGSRPRLPWGIALEKYKKNPTEILEVLEILQDDSSLYVRKSVANNLNDITKDNPDIAKKVFKKWYGKNKQKDWIVKHGARTLLKASDSYILNLFGYKSTHLGVSNVAIDKSIKLGDYFHFSFDIHSQKSLGNIRLEYKFGLLRKNNTYNYKVFKISEKKVNDKNTHISKAHHFKEVTTRAYYKGIQTITIMVNGKEFETKEFYLDI